MRRKKFTKIKSHSFRVWCGLYVLVAAAVNLWGRWQNNLREKTLDNMYNGNAFMDWFEFELEFLGSETQHAPD